MLINVSSLINNQGERLEVSCQMVLEPIIIGCSTFEFKQPMEVSAVFISLGESIELNARVVGVVISDCARCTCAVEVPFEFTLDELLKKSVDADSDIDVMVFSGSEVDLSAIISDNFALNAPMRVLCKDDCSGLCQACGTDLNKTDCECQKKATDPRFSVLDQLFKDNT